MQDLRVTLVQANQIWEDKQLNLDNYSRLLLNSEETDVIVLPEMFHTSFTMNAEKFAETMEDSLGLNWLKETAKQKNAAIYTSLIIKENNHFYNRGVFVYPTGEISTYDKRQTFGLAGEDKVFTAGKVKTIVEYKGWKIQLQICYDLRFPEIARNELDANQNPIYDALIYVANWPEKRRVHWQTLLTARAIENQCYTIGLNRVGEDGTGLIYSGDSQVSDLLGETVNLTTKKEEIRQIILSKESLTKTRLSLPFLKDKIC
jgi:predicted amidohydrolase